jgi:hypothetical protein
MISVIVPIRTGGGLNDRVHWATRARKVKVEREQTAWALQIAKISPEGINTVRLTRLGPSRGLDGDNLQGSLKAVRDAVAMWLWVDDGDPRVTWDYSQERAKSWGVRVELSQNSIVRPSTNP